MAIKRSSKVDASFSSSSMTDLIFLLLVFFILATTLINPNNAVKLTLPSSSSDEGDPSVISLSVVGATDDESEYLYYSRLVTRYCVNLAQLSITLVSDSLNLAFAFV